MVVDILFAHYAEQKYHLKKLRICISLQELVGCIGMMKLIVMQAV
jgi:hypothetical protein